MMQIQHRVHRYCSFAVVAIILLLLLLMVAAPVSQPDTRRESLQRPTTIRNYPLLLYR